VEESPMESGSVKDIPAEVEVDAGSCLFNSSE